MASAATESVQGTWKKKPCVPGTAKNGHCPPIPHSLPLATLSSPHHPQAHEPHGFGFGLCCEVAGREQRPIGRPVGEVVFTTRFL